MGTEGKVSKERKVKTKEDKRGKEGGRKKSWKEEKGGNMEGRKEEEEGKKVRMKND